MRRASHFPRAAYHAYRFRDVPEENVELTHVGPGTPCGEYLRRFWQPVALSDDLGEVPNRIRVMGEDLVLFRDGSRRIGLLQLHCSHRGTSLEFGRIAERGIRCCYHGWLFDVDGRILETPGGPPETTLKDRLWHGAYPARECGGLIFAYMGPPDEQPEFPILDTFDLDGYSSRFRIYDLPCNWLQVKENCMDPVHTAFLHTIVSGPQFTEEFGAIPELEWQETANGMIYIATRRVGDFVWVRINDFILPNIHQFPPHWEDAGEERIFARPMGTVWAVPVDNTNTMSTYWYHFPEERNIDDVAFENLAFGQDGDRSYADRQWVPGDYDAQVSQRPIARHGLEHLGWSDRGITMLRKLITREIRKNQSQHELVGINGNGRNATPTVSQDTVLPVPKASSLEEDRELIRDIGRRVAGGDYLGRA